jgi:hypothetical protein
MTTKPLTTQELIQLCGALIEARQRLDRLGEEMWADIKRRAELEDQKARATLAYRNA